MRKTLSIMALLGMVSIAVYLFSDTVTAQQTGNVTQFSQISTMMNTSVSAENIEMVSHLGGSAAAVAVKDGYAYVGIGPRLVIYDVTTNAPNWIKVGTTEVLSDSVIDIALAGNYAYLALRSKVAVLDISSPTQPVVETSISTSAIELHEDNNYLYVAGFGLKIFDVTTPDQPEEISFLNNATFGGTTLAVEKSGNIAYVTTMDTLHAIDVTDPTQPTHLDNLTTGFQSAGIAIQDNYVFVTSPFEGMSIIDISQPANLSIISTGMSGWGILDVAVNGNTAYVVMYPRGIYSIDISNVNNPTLVGSLLPVRGPSLGIAVAGQYAYIANGWGGLHIADVSNPANMTFVDIDSDSAGIYTKQLVETTNRIHALGGTNGFAGHSPSVDISDPSNPIHDASINLLYNYDIQGLAADENHVLISFVTIQGDDVQIYDANDLSTPLGTWSSEDAQITAMVRNGQHLYGAGSTSLSIVDVANPGSPIEISTVNLSSLGGSGGIVVDGQYAYLGRNDKALNLQNEGLMIWDVSNLAAPTLVSTFTTTGGTYSDVYDVDVAGNLVYLAASDAGLRIIDVSDVSNPVEVGSHPFEARSVKVSGRYAYVTNIAGLGVFDISDPASPVQIGSFDMRGATDILLVNDLIYMASGENGLFVLRQMGRSTTVTADQDASLVYTDPQGKITNIEFPAGSVNSDTILVYSPVAEVASNGLQYAGLAFDLTAYQNGIAQPDFIFSQPVNVTLTYLDDDVLGIAEEVLTLRVFDGSEWVDAATTCTPPSSYIRNPNQNTISVEICHLSQYALMAVGPVFLPFVIR